MNLTTTAQAFGGVEGFNEGMVFARTGQSFESHPLYGLDARHDLDMRVKEYVT